MNQPTSLSVNSWDFRSGVLHVGGCSVSDLISEFGSPLYVYDRAVMEGQFEVLRKAISYRPFRLRYACKANGNLTILRIFRELGAHLDVTSPGEIVLAEMAGFHAEHLLFTGSSVTDEELAFVERKGVLINFDSISQLRRYGRRFPHRDICLRLNLDVGAGHHEHVITGGPDSKFGITAEDLPDARQLARQFDLRIVGLHQHIGSGILDAQIFLRAVEPLLEVARDFEDLLFLNVGGGLGIPYAPEDRPLDLAELGEGMTRLCESFCRSYGRRLRLELEPGRFLVGPAGCLLTRVNTVKRTSKHVFAGTDSGFNHLIRHPLYRSYHRIINATREDGPVRRVAVCGNLCESGDLFTHGREIIEPREGDILAICDAGAYGYSMSFPYNMRPRPAEVLVDEGRAWLIRRRERIEDLVALFPPVAI
ncbi:MAG: diaminopimelate decarboxylase [Acidobacteria bacterium]|nr:MAG: diaminopimelate decarboxylase [Acidobacteriota bacterium]